MRIPIGNFGNEIAAPAPRVNVPAGAFGDYSGLKQLADTGMAVAGNAMQEQKQEALALKRAEAANTALDREIAVKQNAHDIEQKLADGSLHYNDAQAEYRKRLADLPQANTSGMDAVTAENLSRGIKRVDTSGMFSVDAAASRARTADFKGQTDLAIDKLGKLAGMPGADVEAVTKQIHQLDALGQVAYGKNWPAKKQEFTDRAWFNEATQKTIAAKNDIGALTALEGELTNGSYVGKLDTEKRSILTRSITNEKMRLENKLLHESDKIEKRAEATVKEIDTQISSGVPATPQMWATWSVRVKGTSQEQAFNDRINDESKVQEVLRLPIPQQVAFVQQRESALMEAGGSVRDKSNLDRIKKAVDSNTAQLKDAPLLFASSRMGQTIPPLDIAALSQPGGEAKTADAIRERMATVRTLQAQYGSEVKMRPFLPQEVKALSVMLDTATPKQATTLFATLYKAAGDEEAYTAAMRQVAPDAPVKAFAGMLMAKQRKITLESNWIAENVVAGGGDVGETMLHGEGILNKTKGQKADDGNPRNFPLPPEKEFRDMFGNMSGKVFAGREGGYETAAQAVRAYYTGKAAKDGDVSGVIDTKRMKEAITATLGAVVDYNGNGEVLAPWGMDESTFKDKAHAAFIGEVKRRGMPANVLEQFGALGLQNIGDGTYYVKQGRTFLTDKTGQPVVIDLFNRPNAQSASGKIRVKE